MLQDRQGRWSGGEARWSALLPTAVEAAHLDSTWARSTASYNTLYAMASPQAVPQGLEQFDEATRVRTRSLQEEL